MYFPSMTKMLSFYGSQYMYILALVWVTLDFQYVFLCLCFMFMFVNLYIFAGHQCGGAGAARQHDD